jgi:hypothetical protein
MKQLWNPVRASFWLAICALLILVPPVEAEQSAHTKCQLKLYRRTGEYLHCLMNAEAALARGQNTRRNDRVRAACAKAYQRSYDAALQLSAAGCPFAASAASGSPSPLDRVVQETTGKVHAMVSGNPPVPIVGQLTLYNNCAVPIKIMSPTSNTIDGTTLQSFDSTTYPTGSGGGLAQNAPNTFMFAPITSDSQCTLAQCSNWTDIQTAGQRMGYMWMDNASNTPPGNNNLVFAAYCQPTNAAASQCTTTSSTPCCGSQMNFDRTFGTTFEITPNGGTANTQDFLDLSTNFGSSPTAPPTLCSAPGADPNNCVTATANVFFNVPIDVAISNSGNCSFPQGGSGLSCTDISCSDAFQYPEDNKQVACPAGTGYVVTLCPGTHQLPVLTEPGATQNTITVKNNLSSSSPCANGNTVTIFTSDGGQHPVPAAGGTYTVQGDYSGYPGLGLQVNNWYWTSESLPVQKGPPQNPDNSGAQFTISDQCAISSAPPVYGKGIETYKIATVASQPGGTNTCLVTIDARPPYTDAVTPGCCAPPLQGFANVCSGPWGVTDNQQPWPPQ